MSSRLVASFLMLAILSTISAQAGTVESNVRICGKADPYQRYGEAAPGLFGNSSTGIQDQFFRFKGYVGIESNTDAPDTTRNDAIADFMTATELRGTKMCVRGNLETVERNGSVSYFMSPKSYQIQEKTEDYLNPSQMPGIYSQRNPTAPVLSLHAIDDAETGRRFVFSELAVIVRSQLAAPCAAIEKAIADPGNFSLIFHRKERAVLTADALQECGPNDALKLRVELRKGSVDKIDGVITVERPAAAATVTLEIHR